MSQLARQVKISPAGLAWICLKPNNPDEETARRIAQIINVDLSKVARLVHENKLEKLAKQSKLNYITQFSKTSVTKPIAIEDAIAGLNAVFHAFNYVIRSVPEEDKPSDFQMYRQAYDIVKGQFLNNRRMTRQEVDSSTIGRASTQ